MIRRPADGAHGRQEVAGRSAHLQQSDIQLRSLSSSGAAAAAAAGLMRRICSTPCKHVTLTSVAQYLHSHDAEAAG